MQRFLYAGGISLIGIGMAVVYAGVVMTGIFMAGVVLIGVGLVITAAGAMIDVVTPPAAGVAVAVDTA